MTSRAEVAVEEIFGLFDKFGQENYIGEEVSQLQHAQQAAACALKEGFDEFVILGAFLHDIGWYCPLPSQLYYLLYILQVIW